jgi:hypothetical protein
MASEWNEPPVALATAKKFQVNESYVVHSSRVLQEEDDDDVKDEWDASDDESKKPVEPVKPVAKKPAKQKSTIADNTPDLSHMNEKDREAYLAAQALKDWGYELTGETSTLGGVLTDVNTTEEAAKTLARCVCVLCYHKLMCTVVAAKVRREGDHLS